MFFKRFRSVTTIALATAALGALVACQTTNANIRPAYALGAERVEACVVMSCARLNLDGASLADYSVLAGLTHVDALMISYTDFADLSDIAPMTQLTELHFGQSEVADLTGLSAFPNLTLLHAQDLPAVDYAPIGQLTGLRELAVGGMNLTNLDFIAGLRQLERLHLSFLDTGVDLSGLARHPSLRSIHLDNIGQVDISVLLTLPRLRTVSINDYATPELQVQIDRLRARGVTVDLEEPVMVVC